MRTTEDFSKYETNDGRINNFQLPRIDRSVCNTVRLLSCAAAIDCFLKSFSKSLNENQNNSEIAQELLDIINNPDLLDSLSHASNDPIPSFATAKFLNSYKNCISTLAKINKDVILANHLREAVNTLLLDPLIIKASSRTVDLDQTLDLDVDDNLVGHNGSFIFGGLRLSGKVIHSMGGEHLIKCSDFPMLFSVSYTGFYRLNFEKNEPIRIEDNINIDEIKYGTFKNYLGKKYAVVEVYKYGRYLKKRISLKRLKPLENEDKEFLSEPVDPNKIIDLFFTGRPSFDNLVSIAKTHGILHRRRKLFGCFLQGSQEAEREKGNLIACTQLMDELNHQIVKYSINAILSNIDKNNSLEFLNQASLINSMTRQHLSYCRSKKNFKSIKNAFILRKNCLRELRPAEKAAIKKLIRLIGESIKVNKFSRSSYLLHRIQKHFSDQHSNLIEATYPIRRSFKSLVHVFTKQKTVEAIPALDLNLKLAKGINHEEAFRSLFIRSCMFKTDPMYGLIMWEAASKLATKFPWEKVSLDSALEGLAEARALHAFGNNQDNYKSFGKINTGEHSRTRIGRRYGDSFNSALRSSGTTIAHLMKNPHQISIDGTPISLTPISILSFPQWNHMGNRNYALLNAAEKDWETLKSTELSENEVMELVARLQYKLFHATPFIRGTAGIVDAIGKACFIAHRLPIYQWGPGVLPDVFALTLSEDHFVSIYPKLLDRGMVNEVRV